jgi:hypothetical protein
MGAGRLRAAGVLVEKAPGADLHRVGIALKNLAALYRFQGHYPDFSGSLNAFAKSISSIPGAPMRGALGRG